jgi:hypothetical protein
VNYKQHKSAEMKGDLKHRAHGENISSPLPLGEDAASMEVGEVRELELSLIPTPSPIGRRELTLIFVCLVFFVSKIRSVKGEST